jgi:uncharacterized heparinase superfamily protein
MRPQQVAGIAERKARERIVPSLPVDMDRWYEREVPSRLRLDVEPLRSNTVVVRESLNSTTRQAYRERASSAADGRVTFMNRTLDIASDSHVDWYADELDDLPRLWRLKLYAFEPVAWTLFGYDTSPDELRESFDAWISDWIETIRIGSPRYLRRAWTPYAVSLRVLNWSRYLACRERSDGADAFDRALAAELCKNASFLTNHIESDVGGNHLVENGAGLVAVGTLFGEAGQQWVDRGVAVLEDAARTQFLSDGCHFERSPMYHLQVLTGYLTARDLLRRAGRSVPKSIERTVSAAVAFADYLMPPDRELPLLNDSVHGQTFPLMACLKYAQATDVEPVDASIPRKRSLPTGRSGTQVTDGSGLGWIDTAVGRLLVDGGPVGPPHLPGHAHSDTLSYLLWLGDTPVVTDTGTFDYEGGKKRTVARGVRGHNTVQVGDDEPIELGGRFLMGPRPVPTVRLDLEGDTAFFEGCYETRPFRRPGYVHHRSIAAGSHWWLVWDRVQGDGAASTKSRIHLHPDVTTSRTDTGAVRLIYDDQQPEREVAYVYPAGSSRLSIETTHYFPQFGVEMDRQTVLVETTDPNGFGYVVTTDTSDPVAVTAGPREKPTTVQLGTQTVELPASQIPLHQPRRSRNLFGRANV